jgi:cold shock CspA family protein
VNAKPGDKELNSQYAKSLRAGGERDPETLAYYFRRAFTRGDTNFEAQFWYARYSFERRDAGAREESRQLFQHLREAPMPHEERVRIRDVLRQDEQDTIFTGAVTKREETYGFVQRDGIADEIFCHRDNTNEQQWSNLRVGTRVAFKVGFSFAGIRALELQVLG